MKFRTLFLLLGDISVLYGSLALTLWLRHRSVPFGDYWAHHVVPFTLIFVVWLFTFHVYDLYNRSFARMTTHFFETLVQAMVVNVLLAVSVFYFAGVFQVTPKTNLVLFSVIFALVFTAWRALSGLGQQADDHAINSILVYEEMVDKETERQLYRALLSGKSVMNAASFAERTERRIPIERADISWLLYKFEASEKREFELFKRGFDIVLSCFLILLFSIPGMMIAIAVKVSSSGSVLFRQKRTGKLGVVFTIYKFRSMVQSAEATGPQWAQKNDPRITRFGKILRHTHLDEIPQLFNVIKGDMSFVGPRPERPEIILQLEEDIPFYGLRHLVKPGITGWAQVSYQYGASVEDAKQKLAYDLYYITHRSLFWDLRIIAKTVSTIFLGEGRSLHG